MTLGGVMTKSELLSALPMADSILAADSLTFEEIMELCDSLSDNSRDSLDPTTVLRRNSMSSAHAAEEAASCGTRKALKRPAQDEATAPRYSKGNGKKGLRSTFCSPPAASSGGLFSSDGPNVKRANYQQSVNGSNRSFSPVQSGVGGVGKNWTINYLQILSRW